MKYFQQNIFLLKTKYVYSIFFILFASICFIQSMFFFIGNERVFSKMQLAEVPKNSVGVVLGTSSHTADGNKNIFFENRMNAVKELYDAGKIDCILLSGDNSTVGYNEPVQMQKSLLKLGIPGERMYLDYAGLRTRDSILRARDIFGINQYTLISQRFHIDRALYHAYSENMDVIGYEAKSVPFSIAPRVYIREFFSRFVAVYDRYVGTEAKFSGEKIHIEYDETVRPLPSKICFPRN